MPNYRETVQTKITFELYATDGSFYATSGTPPTLKVQKNKAGAPAAAAGTLAHEGSGLWSYIPSVGEVAATCTALHLTWSGAGIQSGGLCQDFENDFTPTISGRVDAAITSRSATGAAMTLATDAVNAAALATDAAQEIRNSITGYAGALGDGSGRVVITPSDQATLIAAIWAGVVDSAGVATLLTRLSATRSGYLDKLNTSGIVASQADITALNQGASRRITLACVSQMERPETGSNTFTVEMRTYDPDGAVVNATGTPTIVPTGIVSGSLAANLSAVSNPSTGVYRAIYTVAAAHVTQEIRFDGSAVLADGTFTMSAVSQVADFVAANFSTADRTTLADILAFADALPLITEIRADVERGGGMLDLAKAAALAAQARVELALPAFAPTNASGLGLKSDLPAAPDNANIAAGAASAATAAAQATTAATQSTAAATDALAAKNRVLLSLPAVAPSNTSGLPLKSDLPAAAPSAATIAAEVIAQSIVKATAGLTGLNQVCRDFTYDGSGNLTGFRIRAYDTAANAQTDDGATGFVTSFLIAHTINPQGQVTKTTTKQE